MEEGNYPKTLIVTPTVLNRSSGAGVTTGNLFRSWPKEKIGQLYCNDSFSPDLSVCKHFFKFKLPIRNRKSPHRLDMHYQGQWDKMIKQQSLFIVQSFKPEVIYTDARDSPIEYLWLGKAMAMAMDIPYVVHVMDDWPERFIQQYPSSRNLLNKELASIFGSSCMNIAISSEMSFEFEKRYNRRFRVFHNTIDTSEWIKTEKNYTIENKNFELVYVGATAPDKELQSLIDIRDCLLDLNKNGFRAKMIIYSNNQWEEIIKSKLVLDGICEFGGFLQHDQLPSILSQADLLLLPINFDATSMNYIKYSMQTKVPEYMASGTPTLVYAPSTSPNARYARDSGWGKVISQRDIELLKSTIIELMQDEQLRREIGGKGRELVGKNHDINSIGESFRKIIIESIDSFIGYKKDKSIFDVALKVYYDWSTRLLN